MCLLNKKQIFRANETRVLFKLILLGSHGNWLHADTILLFRNLKHSRSKASIFVVHHLGDDGLKSSLI
ncbi:hypothetical protein PVAP13_5NG567000 [Panicum virgatum]|uniref:Uncharacterized protein n=1 Tax=Panicum virgatum TaxID=38727 RepID=A0A8T0S7A9_PANVG|nr:hypothetical protein PVAP13_5NG567000 [Panicum virgatum]